MGDQFSTLLVNSLTRRSDGVQDTNGVLKKVSRDKIRHYRQIYLNRPDPITFMTVSVDTSGRVYENFNRLLFLHSHRETSSLTNELPEKSNQFRFLHATCLAWSVVSVFSSMTVFHSFETSYSTFNCFIGYHTHHSSTLFILVSLLFHCRQFNFDPYGDHIQTCHRQSQRFPNTNGWWKNSVCYCDRLVTELKPMNGVTSR
jgi:hypothetical protein